MTTEQIENLELDIPINARTRLIIESAFEWLKENTTLEFDTETGEGVERLPAGAKLFIIKFYDIQMLSVGVTSESIEGLSQSFDTADKNALIWQIAEGLLYPYLKSRVRFVAAERKWN